MENPIEGKISEIKKEANDLFAAKDYVSAINKYGEGIELAESNETEFQLAILHRNRALAFTKCVYS